MNTSANKGRDEDVARQPGGCPRKGLAPAAGADGWKSKLPVEWQSMVVAPCEITRHKEYEIAAERILGVDEDGVRCFYAHSYMLAGYRSDDDEEFYSVIVYGESVRAWRLRDDRWLIYRIVHTDEDCTASRGFYSFSERCPQ